MRNAMGKFEYTIDSNKNIITSVFSGLVSAETVIDYITTVRADPEFHKDLNIICDFRKASLAKGFLEAKKVIDFVIKTSHDRGVFKLAIISNLSDMDSAEIFALFTMPGYVKLCSSESEAESWVST
jgi:hypothetical protein